MEIKIKKRLIISIIFTVLSLLLLRNFWYEAKPYQISMKILNANNLTLTTILNKHFEDRFDAKGVMTTKQKVKRDKEYRIFLNIKNIKKAEKFQITFNNAIIGKPIGISDITLGDKTQKIKKLNHFKSKGAELICKNNKLYIIPAKKDFTVIYMDKLKIQPLVKIHYEIFIIILVLSFLLFYKLVDYMATFQTVQNKSRIEIVFLSAFFIMLFIPMLNISQDSFSKYENRKLATWQPLITRKGTLNLNFGNNVNKWYNDRFNLRNELIRLDALIKYYLSDQIVTVGKISYSKENHFLFNADKYTPERRKILDKVSKNLSILNKYCNSRNIKLYVAIVPTNSLYNADKNDYVNYENVNDDYFNRTMHYLKKKSKTNIVNALPLFRKHQSYEDIYYRTDHHLTDYGSYILYRYLIAVMQKDLVNLELTPQTSFKKHKSNLVRFEDDRKYVKGITYSNFILRDKVQINNKYSYYDYINRNEIGINRVHPRHFIHTNPRGKYRVLVMGDSMIENLVYFLDTSFNVTDKFRVNNGGIKYTPKRKNEFEIKKFYSHIEHTKPDAIVLVLRIGIIHQLAKMYQ